MVVIYAGERSLNSYRHRLNLCKGNTSTIEIPAILSYACSPERKRHKQNENVTPYLACPWSSWDGSLGTLGTMRWKVDLKVCQENGMVSEWQLMTAMDMYSD
jgi:hypothetical protein